MPVIEVLLLSSSSTMEPFVNKFACVTSACPASRTGGGDFRDHARSSSTHAQALL